MKMLHQLWSRLLQFSTRVHPDAAVLKMWALVSRINSPSDIVGDHDVTMYTANHQYGAYLPARCLIRGFIWPQYRLPSHLVSQLRRLEGCMTRVVNRRRPHLRTE